LRRLLDLYCGEGGAGVGYARAGFSVYGVDLNDDWLDRYTRPRPLPLKRYPFRSAAGDVLAVLTKLLANQGVTQAIPPAYTEWIGSQLLEHLAS
jgi:DNA (cytosine-5)-methyltransferase 1